LPTIIWQVATGQPHPGAYGIAHSYEQAREALGLAHRLHLDAATIQPGDLLLYALTPIQPPLSYISYYDI
jgi:hypothetical protein